MKAYVLHAVGDLRYEETDIDLCPDDWCIVKVKACGICSSDVPRVFTKGTYHFPTIPGHEFSGIVQSVANCKHSGLVGKKVGVFPLIPCRQCDQCAQKHFELCKNYDYLGSRRNGGFAECVAVPVWNLVQLPESVSFTEGAMLEPLAVALHAVKIGRVCSGDNVAVVGTGMIGISAAQWAKKMGVANVTVIGRSEAKRSIVENCGLDYNNTPLACAFDFVLEAVGSPSSIQQSIQLVRPGGRLLLMGNPSGDIALPQDVYWQILRKQLTVYGTWNSSYDGADQSDWTMTVGCIANRDIQLEKLVSHVFPQQDLMKGLELMRDHLEPYCKIMTLWNV